jgi:threonylcarbamoyladenosine tRNA methylthiotransferase CDKAL1
MKMCSVEKRIVDHHECGSTIQSGSCASSPSTGFGAKKVYITNVGCVENALAAASLTALFERNQWRPVKHAQDADLVLVNTCGMSDARELDSVKCINKLCGAIDDPTRVIVTGCLAEINPDAIFNQCRGTQVVSPKDQKSLEKIIDGFEVDGDVTADTLPAHFMRRRLRNLNMVGSCLDLCDRMRLPYPPYWKRIFNAFEKAEWHYVHISTGCIYRCSYCAIRFAKGRIRSRSPEQIVDQVRKGVLQGNRRIVLVGDDTGSYGQDLGSSLGELLCRLVDLPGDFGIHVRNLHPMGLLRQMEPIKRAVATGKIQALTVPIQTASDRLLRIMRRHHTVAGLMKALETLSGINPSLLLLTHILVGFPGESHSEFKSTLQLIKDFPFDGVAPDCFSPRKGTEAYAMPDQIPACVRSRRYHHSIASIIFHIYLNSLRWKRATAAETRVHLA